VTTRYGADRPMRVALAGFGNVGREVARRLCRGALPEARLTAISARDLDGARAASADLDPRPGVVPVAGLPAHADVIVECATAAALPEIARVALGAGKVLVPVSVGGLAAHPEILDLAAQRRGRIRIATGALPGLDAIRTAAEDAIRSVRLTSRIRPDSLAHEDYVRERGFDFTTPPAAAVQVFDGTARAAALAFPRHFNVAVTISLAGIGLDHTRVTMFADPEIAGTVHLVEVDGDNLQLRLESRNRPSPANPRTSSAVAPSIIAALRAMISPVQIGS
jgi:aspartate dehydrogenase